MTKAEIYAIIKKKTEQRIEQRGSKNIRPDVWTASNRTDSTKYITKDGRVRLDIDFDTFKELFETALWNKYLLELQICDDELMQQTPERVRRALDLYKCTDRTTELCELIRLCPPMFDYREGPR